MTTTTHTDDQIRAIVQATNDHPGLNASNPYWLIGAISTWARRDVGKTDRERLVAIRELLDLHDEGQPS